MKPDVVNTTMPVPGMGATVRTKGLAVVESTGASATRTGLTLMPLRTGRFWMTPGPDAVLALTR